MKPLMKNDLDFLRVLKDWKFLINRKIDIVPFRILLFPVSLYIIHTFRVKGSTMGSKHYASRKHE